MERICEMLLPLVKSKIKPYENLTNNISLMNCMSHISYVPDLKHILIEEDNEKKWSSNQVYNVDNYEEEFYWPSKKYKLTETELRKLKKFYDINNNVVRFYDNKSCYYK